MGIAFTNYPTVFYSLSAICVIKKLVQALPNRIGNSNSTIWDDAWQIFLRIQLIGVAQAMGMILLTIFFQ